MAGFASTVVIQINNDGSVTVEDDGRGIPVEDHPDLQKSTLEGVMACLEASVIFLTNVHRARSVSKRNASRECNEVERPDKERRT